MDRTRSKPVLVVAVLVVLLLPVAYVLSSGPAIYLNETGVISSESLEVVYWPFVWLERNSKVCEDVIGWWYGLWSPNH
jgi:hypothetical protein